VSQENVDIVRRLNEIGDRRQARRAPALRGVSWKPDEDLALALQAGEQQM